MVRWAQKEAERAVGLELGTDAGVASEAGCPAGRLYRECQPSEGCPFSCAHITQQVGCFSDGCEEGCHCPEGTFQHGSACVQVRTHLTKSPGPTLTPSPSAHHLYGPCGLWTARPFLTGSWASIRAWGPSEASAACVEGQAEF